MTHSSATRMIDRAGMVIIYAGLFVVVAAGGLGFFLPGL